MTNRAPDGKWISPGEMLSAWLPKMMDECFGYPPESVLSVAARWCIGMAAREHKRGGELLAGMDGIEDDPRRWHDYKSRQAARWLDTRDILLDAAKRIGELK